MVLDSLRYWVQECHVDGFRFDLAVALGRGKDDGYDRDHPFLVALRTDPVLSRAKLIAEPWDLGIARLAHRAVPAAVLGVERPLPRRGPHLLAARPRRLGVGRRRPRRARARHPARRVAGPLRPPRPRHHRLGQLRHRPRRVHAGRPHGVRHEAQRRQRSQRRPTGPTTTGRGTTASRARTDDPDIAAARRRSMRNLLGTLLLSTGVPMLNAGDEFGRSQRGNNNPYSQDNEISWMSWDLEPWQEDLLETTRHLVRLRREHPVLRQRAFFSGRQVHATARPTSRGSAPTASRWATAGTAPRSTCCRPSTTAPWLSQQSVLDRRQRVGARGRGHAARRRPARRHTSCSGTAPTSAPLPRASPCGRARSSRWPRRRCASGARRGT